MPELSDVTRGRLLYGGDYNPEQWPEEVWFSDVGLMREAGVNLVTVGVFSWGRLEPSPGSFDFGWLDRVLDLLHHNGIGVSLATPTASPPPWMSLRHPDTLMVTADGVRMSHGSRNHFCPSSAVYRHCATRITTALARRYASHPALSMWHVNNEYCEVCYCGGTARHFRRWLAARYESLEAVNDAWATTFWSQHYGEWEEILPPRAAPYLRNPTQVLDFRRFCSEALLECFRAERDVLREITPDVPVTTNFMGLHAPLDYWRAAAEQDFVSHDWYPDLEDPGACVESALSYDLMRGLAGGPWFLMEQSASASRGPRRPPGQLRAQSLQAVARGADAVCFFQWRASRAGAEKFHSGMVPHRGADSRVFREVSALGRDLASLPGVVGAPVPAQVAIVVDWDSWWAVGDEHLPARIDLLRRLRDFYEPLWRLGIVVDFVRPSSDLAGYRLVLAPNLYLLTAADAAGIRSYVDGGGTFVMGFLSGVVDENDHVLLGGCPALLTDVMGLCVSEFLPQSGTLTCDSELLGSFVADFWADDVETTTASVVAAVSGGELEGMPVVLRNDFGEGTAWYVATRPSSGAMRALLGHVASQAGVPSSPPPEGVEVVRRGDFQFVINHRSEPAEVVVDGAHTDLLSGEVVSGAAVLPRYGVKVLQALP
ncbi:beta-galactosidase [Lentzea sp.]|uniref:beta-galactosidase n=1 Tax=Lentzea sp. TaxID=56099 RepID=UPI002C1F3717|nr:beta-galactosidase [Lentzea sp.]HUQ60854.1 beta-galactosidase [Lentzea sp.]